jgi:hypothetical protein
MGEAKRRRQAAGNTSGNEPPDRRDGIKTGTVRRGYRHVQRVRAEMATQEAAQCAHSARPNAYRRRPGEQGKRAVGAQRLSRSSHSSVAKKLSHIALS